MFMTIMYLSAHIHNFIFTHVTHCVTKLVWNNERKTDMMRTMLKICRYSTKTVHETNPGNKQYQNDVLVALHAQIS